MRRDHNEDAFSINPDSGLYIVADGMGGHNSGEIASKLAIETIENFFRATSTDDEITWPYKYDPRLTDAENRLKVSTMLANSRIWEASRRNELYHGMGTTVVGVYYRKGMAYLVNVGDSRGYAFRGGILRQVTEDHSLLNDLLKQNKMTPDEVANFPHKNVIVRALGIKEEVDVDLFRYTPQHGDVILLCSDGLSDMVKDQQIQDLLTATPDVKLAAKLLVREANLKGGHDNITAVLVQFA
ncbi:MAG: Stp1/IreP family PP2C-type Ser/Thr phosphatase [Myxococcales bacterium]|nr:MAG: Stp1/IreP family PP2C-type Ser/Thr phosphatase [Myxococcales bacterium]